MKTILEHLNQLPEPYRTQAINNTSKEDYNYTAKDRIDAITKAFFFHKTPEGSNYWADFIINLEDYDIFQD